MTAIRPMRLATHDDLATIADIHREAYSRSHFTALLSHEVLMRYYAAFLSNGTEICVGLDDVSGAVKGFSVYGVGIPDKIAVFKKACAKAIFLTSLRHPGTAIPKALKALRSRFDRHVPYAPADFLLLSIAVVPSMRGLGNALLSELLKTAHRKGHGTVGLYVNDENIRAIDSYYRSGFRMKDFHGNQYYMEAQVGSI
ncbi:GNAT family N-acetyltransferase [Sphingomonas hankookensis]|uniref:GNAT family N-acetyltransferase n=1 Tax=Sphingomonas hankookensis TaxID=563996 RepID=UPI001F59DA4B|nr:GNAT family N-acetyltransferase [Sphingomonas hankookensis]